MGTRVDGSLLEFIAQSAGLKAMLPHIEDSAVSNSLRDLAEMKKAIDDLHNALVFEASKRGLIELDD